MRILLQITGVSGLVMHNPRLIDPTDPYVKQIAEITSKGSKQTDAEREEVARLEWFGGIYHDSEAGVYVPTWNIVKCLNRGAVQTKEGAKVLRAISVVTDRVSVVYDGPRELPDLYARVEYRFRKEVGIGQKKVMRMRPIFRKWRVEFEAEIDPDGMNPADLLRVATTAGRAEGLLDARKLGYGRFTVEMAS